MVWVITTKNHRFVQKIVEDFGIQKTFCVKILRRERKFGNVTPI